MEECIKDDGERYIIIYNYIFANMFYRNFLNGNGKGPKTDKKVR